jgi:hypothetical protein
VANGVVERGAPHAVQGVHVCAPREQKAHCVCFACVVCVCVSEREREGDSERQGEREREIVCERETDAVQRAGSAELLLCLR